MKVNDRHCSFYYEKEKINGKLEFNPEKTALLIVDLQNYFVKRPDYNLEDDFEREEKERWNYFYDIVENVVLPNNKKLLDEARNKEMLVSFATIVTQLSSGRDRSLSQKESGFNNLMILKGTEEAKIHESITPIKDEIVIEKTTDSALTGSNLRLLLHNCGITDVIVTGVLTDQCVSGTVRSLADESFKVWLVEDGCMAATKDIQDHELKVLNNIYCNVINTQEIIDFLRSK
ncbi:MAG: isochorismatase family cysteine hydrolase [Lagierella massiliensis]|nr:isochorismatase family cysteine hydrolase [Lagierella massiliensis]